MDTYFLLAASDLVWQAAIAGVVTIALAWIATRTSKKLDEIKATAITTQKTTDVIHDLTNSNFSTQLHLAAIALRRVADLTRDTTDISAAVLAEKAYADHLQVGKVVPPVPIG